LLPFLIAAIVVSGTAAWFDYRTGHIPNWATFGALCVAVVAHLFFGFRAGGFRVAGIEAATSLGGALLCALAPGLLYWKGGIGGGDVKLFAAIGALVHPMLGLEAECYAFVAAALIAPAQMAYRGDLLRVFRNSFTLFSNPFRKKEARKEIPPEMLSWFRLGPSIFVGACVTLLSNWYAL
jgi:prepilin peptidase CpaA